MACLTFQKNRKRWRVLWRATDRSKTKNDPSRLFRGSQVFYEKGQAVRFFAQKEEEEKIHRSGMACVSESLMAAIDSYYNHAKRFTKRTQTEYHRTIDRFMASLNRRANFASIEPSDIDRYLHSLKVSNRTKNAQLTAIKSFCRFCSERMNLRNPSVQVKMLPENPPKVRIIEPDEYLLILEAATPSARARIEFIANTGLRASEVGGLTWTNIHGAAIFR